MSILPGQKVRNYLKAIFLTANFVTVDVDCGLGSAHVKLSCPSDLLTSNYQVKLNSKLQLKTNEVSPRDVFCLCGRSIFYNINIKNDTITLWRQRIDSSNLVQLYSCTVFPPIRKTRSRYPFQITNTDGVKGERNPVIVAETEWKRQRRRQTEKLFAPGELDDRGMK
uniref:Uncharacterized protein n=1 Tax=Strigamia maritima TaxID=126957 RepID=T1JCZ8_STRMM